MYQYCTSSTRIYPKRITNKQVEHIFGQFWVHVNYHIRRTSIDFFTNHHETREPQLLYHLRLRLPLLYFVHYIEQVNTAGVVLVVYGPNHNSTTALWCVNYKVILQLWIVTASILCIIHFFQVCIPKGPSQWLVTVVLFKTRNWGAKCGKGLLLFVFQILCAMVVVIIGVGTILLPIFITF